MKSSLTILVLLFSITAFSQESAEGRIVKDTLFLTSGAKFVIGDKVKLGYGSNPRKDFQFITLSPWSIAGPVPLGSAWNGLNMTVKDFKFEGTKRQGKKFYLVMKGGNLSPYWADVVAAVEQKEIVVPGVNDKSAGQPTGSATSLADELSKLKKLYSDSTLTKEEYEAAKKKLIGN